MAREEHGNGFALRGMQDEAAVQTDPAAIGGEPVPPAGEAATAARPARAAAAGGPRRGRREMAEKPE